MAVTLSGCVRSVGSILSCGGEELHCRFTHFSFSESRGLYRSCVDGDS